MKSLTLKLLVVILLAIMLILAPIMYTQTPKAVLIVPVTRNAHIPAPSGQVALAWYQKPQQDDKYFGIPSEALSKVGNTSKIYLLPNEQPTVYYDAGASYLLLPSSSLSKFMTVHQAEVGATTAALVYGNLDDKYQIANKIVPVLEVAKTANTAQITLHNLSPATYQNLLEQAKLDPELNNMIISKEPSQGTIVLDPSSNKQNLHTWLKKAWQYLQKSTNPEKQLGI